MTAEDSLYEEEHGFNNKNAEPELTEEYRIKMINFNPATSRYRATNRGGICMTSEILKKLNASKKDYVEVESLIKWLRYTLNKYYADDYPDNAAILDFIELVEGVLVNKADEAEIEYI